MRWLLLLDFLYLQIVRQPAGFSSSATLCSAAQTRPRFRLACWRVAVEYCRVDGRHVLHERAVDENLAAADLAQDDAFGAVVEEGDVVEKHGGIEPENHPQYIVGITSYRPTRPAARYMQDI